MNENPKFTEEDFDACWAYHKSYFIDVLNGDLALEDARENLRGLIGSEFDPRVRKQHEQKAEKARHQTEGESDSQLCSRCGLLRSEAKNRGCSVYGTLFPTHMWRKT